MYQMNTQKEGTRLHPARIATSPSPQPTWKKPQKEEMTTQKSITPKRLTFWWPKKHDEAHLTSAAAKKKNLYCRPLCALNNTASCMSRITVQGNLRLGFVSPQHHFRSPNKTAICLYLKINYTVTKHLCSLKLW